MYVTDHTSVWKKGKLAHSSAYTDYMMQCVVLFISISLVLRACTRCYALEHTSSIPCHCVFCVYTGTELYCLLTEAHGSNNLLKIVT